MTMMMMMRLLSFRFPKRADAARFAITPLLYASFWWLKEKQRKTSSPTRAFVRSIDRGVVAG